mgnify:CR=1 FL=1
MIHKVNCWFNKWLIGYDDEKSALIVEFSYHPNYGTIELHDMDLNEMEKIGEMFTGLAKLYKSQLKK